MGFFSGVKKVITPLVNVPRWMNLKDISVIGGMIVGVAKTLFIPEKTTVTESFEDALIRLRLTEADIEARRKEFRRLVVFFSLITLALLAYDIYQFSQGHIRAGILVSVLTSIALVQVFRYHFWLFQIKQRKLGCTVREWFWTGLLGKSL